MNRFDFLALGNAAIALIALYQLRPCTLLLAGNNALVSLGLGKIQQYGPPASSAYLPIYVFSDENLGTAFAIMAISLASLVGFTIIAARQHARIGPEAPVVPRPVLIVIAIYLVLLAGSTATVVSGPYVRGQEIRYDMNFGGLNALICSLVVYELVRRRLLFLISPRKAFGIIFVIFAATGYAKGGTGFPTGYLVASAVLMLPHSGVARRLGDTARIALVLGGLVFFALMVRTVRSTLHEVGTGAIAAFGQGLTGSDGEQGTSGGDPLATTNATQSADHILECVTLYDGGVSREWRSIYDVIEYTFKPSFLQDTFGWQRSQEAAWELADHFVHGGGLNILGEFYWNGGFLCVFIMATALSFFCFILDKNWRSSPFCLLMLTQFAPPFLMGYGYGFAQASRGAINGLLVAAVYKGLSIISAGKFARARQPDAVANLAASPSPGL
ncbi:MAG: hypothetical protein ACLQIJ_06340 [Polyangia bacterium]